MVLWSARGDGENGFFSVPMALSEPRGTLKKPFSPSPLALLFPVPLGTPKELERILYEKIYYFHYTFVYSSAYRL